MRCKPIQDACRAYVQTNGFLKGMSQAAIGVIFAYPLFALLNSVAGTVVFAYFEAPSFYFFILSAGLLFTAGNFVMLMAGFGAQAVVALVAFIMAIVNSARWGGFAFSIISALLELVAMGLLTLLSYKAYAFGRTPLPAAYLCPQCGGPVAFGASFCQGCGMRFQQQPHQPVQPPPQAPQHAPFQPPQQTAPTQAAIQQQPNQPPQQTVPQQSNSSSIPQQSIPQQSIPQQSIPQQSHGSSIPQQSQSSFIPQQTVPKQAEQFTPRQTVQPPKDEQATQQDGKICPACNRKCASHVKFCGGCGHAF